MPSYNNWGVEYSAITFFKRVLRTHNRVESFTRSDDILFRLQLITGEVMEVLLVSEYTVGVAAVIHAIDEFPDINHIVTSGVWFGYTEEAKQYGLDHNVGVFVIDEFLGALNWANPIKYTKKDPDGNPTYRYKTAT